MWSLGFAIVLCSQEDGKGILSAEGDWVCERFCRSETGCNSSVLGQLECLRC